MTDSERLDAERRRRMIVDLLGEDPAGSHSAPVLSAALRELGEPVPADQVDRLLDWLAEEGLVEFVSECEPRPARVTDRGRRVARGDLAVEGVAPRPD